MSQDAPKMTAEEEMFAGLEKGLWGKREVANEQNTKTNTNEQFSRRDSMRKELVRKILSYVQ